MSKNNSLNETSTWRVGRKENPVKDSKKKQVRRDTGQSDPSEAKEAGKMEKRILGKLSDTERSDMVKP